MASLDKPDKRQVAGFGPTFFNLCNVTLGAGILSYPSAFAQGGWLGSTAFTLTIAAVSYISSRALVRCAAHTGAETEASVGGFTVGPWFEFVGNVSLVAFGVGACTGYLLVIGDYIPEVMAVILAGNDDVCDPAWLCARETAILTLGTAIIFPLCVKDNITSLAWASAGGLCSIVYTTIVVVWEALTIEPVSAAVGAATAAAAAGAGPGEQIVTYRAESEPLERYDSFAGVLGTAGIVVFSFVVQMQVPTIFVEVRDPAKPREVMDAVPIVNAVDDVDAEDDSGTPSLYEGDPDSSGDEASILARTSDGTPTAKSERASLLKNQGERDNSKGMYDGEVNGGDDVEEGCGTAASGEAEKESKQRREGRSWRPLSDADARRVELFETAISAQTAIVVLLYVSFGIAGYSLFGRTVDSDILVSFPRDDTPIVIGRVAISFVASVSYPCIHFASREMLHNLLGGRSRMSVPRRWCLTLLYYLTTLAAALVVKDLGTLWTIFGSTTGWYDTKNNEAKPRAVMFAIPASALVWDDGPWGAAADSSGHEHSGFVAGWVARAAGWFVLLAGTAICGYCIVLSV